MSRLFSQLIHHHWVDGQIVIWLPSSLTLTFSFSRNWMSERLWHHICSVVGFEIDLEINVGGVYQTVHHWCRSVFGQWTSVLWFQWVRWRHLANDGRWASRVCSNLEQRSYERAANWGVRDRYLVRMNSRELHFQSVAMKKMEMIEEPDAAAVVLLARYKVARREWIILARWYHTWQRIWVNTTDSSDFSNQTCCIRHTPYRCERVHKAGIPWYSFLIEIERGGNTRSGAFLYPWWDHIVLWMGSDLFSARPMSTYFSYSLVSHSASIWDVSKISTDNLFHNWEKCLIWAPVSASTLSALFVSRRWLRGL